MTLSSPTKLTSFEVLNLNVAPNVDEKPVCSVPVDRSQPVFSTAYSVYKAKGPVVAGISINNGYFDEATVTKLIHYLISLHSLVFCFIPDTPSVNTYRGLGYSDTEAIKKVKYNKNRLVRWIQAASKCKENVLDETIPEAKFWLESPHRTGKVILLNWNEHIGQSPKQAVSLKEIMNLFTTNSTFKEAVMNTTTQVLKGKQKRNITLEDGLAIASTFLLEELAFLWIAKDLLNLSQDWAYVYHQRWPVFERFVNGELFEGYNDDNAKDLAIKGIGFIVKNFDVEAEGAAQIKSLH